MSTDFILVEFVKTKSQIYRLCKWLIQEMNLAAVVMILVKLAVANVIKRQNLPRKKE